MSSSPNRPARHDSDISDPNPRNSSGLIQAVQNTGRDRDSSATPTPSICSPTPIRDLIHQVARMDINSQAEGNLSHQDLSHPVNRSAGSHYHARHDQYGQVSSILDESCANWQNSIDNNPDFSTKQKMQLKEGVQMVYQDLSETHRTIVNLLHQNRNDNTELRAQLEDTLRKLQECDQAARCAISDRDRAVSQRDSLQSRVNELMEQVQKNEHDHEKSLRTLHAANESMSKPVAEQLEGKRALWMEMHPTPKAPRDALNDIPDPFDTPTALGHSDASPLIVLANSPTLTSELTSSRPPPNMPQLAPALHGRRSLREIAFGTCPIPPNDPYLPLPYNYNGNQIIKSEPGDIPINPIYREPVPSLDPNASPSALALIARCIAPDAVSEIVLKITKLYTYSEAWAMAYANEFNPDNDQKIFSANQHLTSFMLNLIFPGQPRESHSHATVLLREDKCRYFYVMAIIIRYIYENVICVEVFSSFDMDATLEFNRIKVMMQERGLANEARQALIDKQASTVQNIITSKHYEAFRRKQITHHTKGLRDMVGPMLNNSAARGPAGKDLGLIVITAWDVAVLIFASHMTFQIYFPKTADRFSATTMIAKDVTNNPLQLQIRQTRLKLVITPVIVMRDDRSNSIKVKNLHKSAVLTMH